ncbi:hypothetical protein TNCV_2649021 [Trichonephila clavipes]|nr:hypothetical protein TNCV_2649021 [Trichonephila clavipes]
MIFERKRKLDLTGASEMNRLYPNSRRESGNEKRYLNTPPQGEDGGRSGQAKTRKYTLRGQEWRSARKGGLTAPKRVRGAPKRNRNREAAGIFFLQLDE